MRNDAALECYRTYLVHSTPKDAPKGILLHGGPPSDSSFRLDEGTKEKYLTYGASAEETATCRSVTTKVCCLYDVEPHQTGD